jgi:hypothetical protein
MNKRAHNYYVSFSATTVQVEAGSYDMAEFKARLELKDSARCTGVVDQGEADDRGGDSIED